MDILQTYIDKSYITTLLCDLSYNHYNTIYNISLAPTILGSSILTILNSSEIDASHMKIINISLNGLNTLILALMSSYKINDRINTFKTLKAKFNKLTHILESIKNNKKLSHLSLIKQSRLSVMPIDSISWKILNNMGKI